MKSAFHKEVVRSIGGSLGRFFAIVIISFLGAGVYAGLRMSAPDMRIAADEFYDATRMYDVAVVCSYGLDDQSLDTLRDVEGVAQVMGAYKSDALVQANDASFAASIESLSPSALESSSPNEVAVESNDDDYLNRPVLLEGAWPEKADECVIGSAGAQEMGLAIGDTIKLQKGTADLNDTFAQFEYTVTGLVNSAAYIADTSLGVTKLADGSISLYMYVPTSAFDDDLPYTIAYLSLKAAAGEIWDNPGYEQVIEPVIGHIEKAATAIGVAREATVRADAQQELDDNRAEYEQERADAERELEDGAQELADAKVKLQDAQTKLQNAKDELDSSEKTLRSTKTKLESSETEYEKGSEELQTQRASLQQGIDALPQLEAQLAALESLPEAPADQVAALKTQIASIKEGKAALEQAEATLAQSRAQLDEGWKQYNEGVNKRAAGLKEYEEGLVDYEDGVAEYEKGLQEYEENRAKAESEFADAEKELADAQEEIDDLEPAEVFVMDRSKNAGAATLAHDAESITQIATYLPFMFFLVAALVILTSMTRMVDEDRLDIGTHKALGYGKARITSKYLVYGIFASGVGSVLGVIVLGKLLPWFIMTSYSINYSIPIQPTPIDLPIAAQAVGLSVAVAIVAILGAAMATLRERPAALMLPKAPKPGKRILLERITPIWKHMTFSHKVTARNLLRYKRRFFMAVIGIAGCTALLMVGFGMRDAIGSIISNQFEELTAYDAKVQIDTEADSSELNAMDEALEKLPIKNKTLIQGESMIAEGGTEDVLFEVVVPSDADSLNDYIVLRDRESGESVPLTNDVIVITEKAADELGVGIGDTITLYGLNDVGDREGAGFEFTVGGITENYLQHYAYLLPETYEAVTGEAPVYNRYLIQFEEGADTQQFLDAMADLDVVETASIISEQIVSYEEMLDIMTKLIVVVVLLAAGLAFVVLYNLTNINICERIREIATLKVLGFTRREVDSYIFREIIIMAIIGALLGCILGVPLTLYIAKAAETADMMFGRNIEVASFVFSFAITLVFTFIITLFMRPKLNNVNMVESLKSVE